MTDHHPREIQLTSKQLVFVFMSTVLVAVVVFLLGVWVGRGIDAGSMAATEDVMGGGLPKSANPSSPGGGPPASGDQKPYVYPEALTPRSGGAAATGASAATTPPPADPPASSDPGPALPPTQPASPPSAPPPQPEKAPDESWGVQVGAYSARSGAEKVAAEFKGKGYPVTVTAGPTFRVWIGPYARKAADQIAIRLRKEGKDASVIKPR
jgi:cell division protein FtsN